MSEKVGIKSMGNIDDRSAYAHSFGLLPNHTVYAGSKDFEDKRPELKAICEQGMAAAQLKALSNNTMGAGTAGYSLIPVYVDPRIVDRSRKFTPWTEILQRVTNQGVTADYNYISAKGAAHTKFESAAQAEQDDTEARASTAIKYLYAVGSVTGPVQAAMPSYMVQGLNPAGNGMDTASFNSPTAPNAKQYQVLKRAQALKELEENLIWNGNATTSAITGNDDGTEYSGIITLQSTTNTVGKSTTALDWADIETAVQYAYDDSGRPNVAGASSSVVADIRNIMVDQFRMNPGQLGGSAGFGIPAPLVVETMVGPIPIVPSQYISNTTGSKAIYFLDTENIEMRVLQDMTYEDLAKTNDSQKFMLKMYEALIMTNTSFNGSVTAIK